MPRKTLLAYVICTLPPTGFNEAAARCRGKPSRSRPSSAWRTSGFNEAAARCRGKLGVVMPYGRIAWSFNEAAARCRGKRRGPT